MDRLQKAQCVLTELKAELRYKLEKKVRRCEDLNKRNKEGNGNLNIAISNCNGAIDAYRYCLQNIAELEGYYGEEE